MPSVSAVIGEVGAPCDVITVSPVTSTDANDDGDLLFDATEIPLAARLPGLCTLLTSLCLIDPADQKAAMTLVFLNANTDMGTVDSAPNPDDTEALTVVGTVAIAVSDYVDLGGASVACLGPIGKLFKTAADTRSLWVAAIGAGTPNYGAASVLKLQLGFIQS